MQWTSHLPPVHKRCFRFAISIIILIPFSSGAETFRFGL